MRQAVLIAVTLALVPSLVIAQRKFPPDSATNLQFFPKNTPVPDLIARMRGFTNALGVRCQHCHVGQEGQPLDRFDFASDEKKTKQTARVMLRMVANANQEFLAAIPDRATPTLEVRCGMCHRGVARPAPLGDLMTQAVASAGGLDSATRAYRALRERYYGRAAYDFGENTLNDAAFGLARSKQWDQAVGLLTLNEEHFPKSAGVQVTFAEVYRQKGDTAAAIGRYRAALAIDPNDPGAKRGLTQLGQEP